MIIAQLHNEQSTLIDKKNNKLSTKVGQITHEEIKTTSDLTSWRPGGAELAFLSVTDHCAPMFEQGVPPDLRNILWIWLVPDRGTDHLSLASASTASAATTATPLPIAPSIAVTAPTEA